MTVPDSDDPCEDYVVVSALREAEARTRGCCDLPESCVAMTTRSNTSIKLILEDLCPGAIRW